MPKGKKRTDEPQGNEAIVDMITTETGDEGPSAMEGREPPLATEPRIEAPSRKEEPRGQFRSWTIDPRRGYSGMSDVQHRCLVLQFDAKPHPDVLAAVREADFQFKPLYHGLTNVWIRRNDYQGRVKLEAIERLIRSFSPEPESLSV